VGGLKRDRNKFRVRRGGKEKGEKTGFQLIKAQERKIWWEGLNGYRNKFGVPERV